MKKDLSHLDKRLKLSYIGITKPMEEKLKPIGVETPAEFLDVAKTTKGRRELADSLSVTLDKITTFANRADLVRIDGLGTKRSTLLEKVGVDTVVELSMRNPDNLIKKMAEKIEEDTGKPIAPINLALLKRTVPAWIDQAKTLPRVLSY